jgi:putative ABC transport system permease protein
VSLWRIAWRSIQQRALASSLTAFSMALGVMLLVSVLSIHGVIERSFQTNASLGYNMILGAKGGKLQLTLNTVYYLSQPIENLPYDYYLEFLPAERRDAEWKNALFPSSEASRDGKYAPFVELAIPVCLGDYYGHFRVVGTTPEMFEDLRFGPSGDRRYEFSAGRNFRVHTPENGFFEAVVGATVAREMKVKVGNRIATTHGDPEGFGHGEYFTVVGILANSGTPQDRAVFVNMEGFFLMEGHAKPLDELPISEAHRAQPARNEPLSQEGWSGEVLSRQQQLALDPLPLEQRQVTSILVRTISPIVGPGLSNEINQGPIAQAVMPVREIYQLFNLFVRPAQMLLLLMSGLICIVSGVSILVSIYNSMSERRHEIAVMRALGAERQTVMTVILCESMILSLGGGMIGWVLGHGLNWAIGPLVEARTGVSIGFFDFAPGVDIGWIWGATGARVFEVSTELLLVPALLLLAVIVGIFPALTAYRADVSASLGQ